MGPAAVAEGRLDLEDDYIVLVLVRKALVVLEDTPVVVVVVLAEDQDPIDFEAEVAGPDKLLVDEDMEECSVVVAGSLAEGHHTAAADILVVAAVEAAAVHHTVLEL